MYKLAEIFPILLREQCAEDSWSNSEEIQEIFGCLISAGDFLCRISWWVTKR
jgi:hypothetical protein